MAEDWEHLEWFEERAAIIEYDGGLPQSEAEVQAYWAWRSRFPGVRAPAVIVKIVESAKDEMWRASAGRKE